MEFAHRLSNMDFHSLRPVWLQTPPSACHPRPTLSPRYVTVLQVISQQLSGGKLITLDCFYCFHHGRGSILLSLEQTLIPDTDLRFSACNASAKTFLDLQNAVSIIMVFQGILIKEFTSQQMKFSNGPMIMEFTSLTKFPIILKQAGLVKW